MPAEKRTRPSERRLATVLFADVSEFTAISEKLDPEEVTNVMNVYFARLESAVHNHGGIIDKYIGDCIMAVFGVPQALENAPKQAINAAIEIRNRVNDLNRQQHLPVPLGVHIGINSGLVIAGDVGGEVRRDFTVMGDTVNLASRLKDASGIGQIWVGPDTYRYTKEEFEYQALKPITVKGKEKPVAAFELRSVKERVHRRQTAPADRMISSTLVGREQPLQMLRDAIGAAIRGEGRLVHLIGEAGLGKSRLLAEALAADDHAGAIVLEGRSLSVGQSLRFHPFVDLLQRWAGIGEDDGEQAGTAKLEDAVSALMPDEASEVFPFLATLMGLRLEGAHAARVEGIKGESLEKLIVNGMRTWLQRLAAGNPVVLVFEDLHWADQSSIQLLESLLGLVPKNPIALILAFRPDYQETSDHILEISRADGRLPRVEIALEPLDQTQCHILISNLLKAQDLPFAIDALIADTAEGNPFYIEEILRSLIEEGVVEHGKDGRLVVTAKADTVVIPDTIQGVIMARVDRLAEPTRHLLQVASVIGRSFYYRILTQLLPADSDVDAELANLKQRQLILEHKTRRTASLRRTTFNEEVEYLFQHALIQETIYESILQQRRKGLHLQVAQAIEAIFADRLSDFYGMLAYHYSRAESLEKAEEYLLKAGAEAASAAASREALTLFREASRIYLAMHGDGGDPKKQALLEKNIALALLNKGDLTESIDHFDRALEHLGESVPRGTLATTLRWAVDLAAVLLHVYLRPKSPGRSKNLAHDREVCEIYFHRGQAEVTSDPRRLFLHLPTGLRRFNGIDPSAVDQACSIYVSCAGIFAYSGISFAISKRMLEVAETLVRPDGVRDRFVYAVMRFVYHYLRGEWADENVVPPDLTAQALRYGAIWDVNMYTGIICDRDLRQGRFTSAAQHLAELAALIDSYGYDFARPNHDIMLGLLLLEERQLKKALDIADKYAASRHEDALKVLGLGAKSKVQILSGDTDAAAHTLGRAEEILRRAGDVSPWHRSHYLIARLLFDVTQLEAAYARGDRARARSGLRQARRSLKRALAGGKKVALQRIETYKLGGVLEALAGKPKRALSWWTRATTEGAQMDALPELGRTYLEIGRFLRTPGRDGVRLDGLDGDAYLEKARAVFEDLKLTWDLARLEAIAPSTVEPMSRRA